jgi:hypothetical protein
MTGRRRYPRYPLAAPMDASLRVREEIAIETWDETGIEAISDVPCPVAEVMTLELAGNGASQVPVVVRESRAFVAPDGAIRYRIRMVFQAANEFPVPDEGKATT